MGARTIQVSENFWNFRGSFKIAGVLDVGTQASLVRLGSGKFVFLDAYSLSPSARREVDELTDGGEQLEAILNLHPFHTLHVERMHEMYPQATLYGTARHLSKFPDELDEHEQFGELSSHAGQGARKARRCGAGLPRLGHSADQALEACRKPVCGSYGCVAGGR